jgi:beta-mannanase
MQANVAAGKTYYALVAPRMGMWKARFSLKPVRGTELGGSDFAGWDSATQFVVNSSQSQAWAAANGIDIAQKRATYWPEWSDKPVEARAQATLNADDGR